jgi:hypothetical protein
LFGQDLLSGASPNTQPVPINRSLIHSYLRPISTDQLQTPRKGVSRHIEDPAGQLRPIVHPSAAPTIPRVRRTIVVLSSTQIAMHIQHPILIVSGGARHEDQGETSASCYRSKY